MVYRSAYGIMPLNDYGLVNSLTKRSIHLLTNSLMINRILILLFSIIVIYSCSKDDDLLKDVEHNDVSYGTDINQKYDIFLPAGRDPETTKVVILIHGGGWTSGDKEDLSEMYEFFKGDDYAVVNLNYTLANFNNPPVPMQTDDIAAAIQHIKDRQDDYSIKPEFALLGASAGAHLSMLYAYRFDEAEEIKVVGNVVGPVDFLHESYTNPSQPETTRLIRVFYLLFGKDPLTNPEYYQDVSPYSWLNENSVPTISFYGGIDLLVPNQQGEILHAALDSLGITNQYVLYEEEGHGWGEPTLAHTLETLEGFLQENF